MGVRIMSPEELSTQALGIRILVGMINKAAVRDLEQRLDACGVSVTTLQFGVMRLLNRSSATITELSSRMLVAPATLVSVVDALERKGLVHRGHDPKDRRRTPLRLTEKGEKVVSCLPFVAGGDSVVRSLSEMGDEKTGQFLDLLGELVIHMTGDEEKVSRALAAFRARQ